MIYIHCENLGLREQHIENLDIDKATAENFSWSFKLSTKRTSKDNETTVVAMPNSLADILIRNWALDKTDDALGCHLFIILEHDSNKWREQFDLSLHMLDLNRLHFGHKNYSIFMAQEIEQTYLDEHEKEIFALLDAQGFVRVEG